ncbi:hypothetical protein [Kineococcus sp. R86509]|uniref:hypothetical protein n=1 Tax=Kineococcus sp. R86509 TaxID=3093851 RepID=UPI0036D39297
MRVFVAWRPHAGAGVHASLVVFLVALPLCGGVASGVPVELRPRQQDRRRGLRAPAPWSCSPV